MRRTRSSDATRRQAVSRKQDSFEELIRQRKDYLVERLECTNYDDQLDKDEGDFVDVENEDNKNDEFVLESDEDELSGDRRMDIDPKDEDQNNTERKTTRSQASRSKSKSTKKSKPVKVSKSKVKTPSKTSPTKDNSSSYPSLWKLLLDEHASNPNTQLNFLSSFATKSSRPQKQICVITLQEAPYRDTETGLPYKDLKALEELRENPPLWTRRNGFCPFNEAKKIILSSNANSNK